MDDRAPRLTLNDWLIAAGIALFFFIATAPTLRWMEFSSGSENLVVSTTLELLRPNDLPTTLPGVQDSTWLLPTLAGQPRIAKPPLATWIAAFFLDEESVAAIRSPNRAVRDAAYADLTWQFRWPALASACLTLVFTYVFGHATGGRRVAIMAALVHGATYAFLRYSRIATTDVQLALWVTAANAMLAMSLLGGRYSIGLPLAGVFLGLAFLAKGPVALIQSVVPVLIFWSWRWRETKGEHKVGSVTLRPYMAATFGIVLFIAVAAPWFIFVARRYDVAALWLREVTRVGATELEPDSPLSYIKLFAMVFPWTIFLIGGVILAVQAFSSRSDGEHAVRHRDGLRLCLFLLVVPILIMTFSKDRKERYLLPMMAPAATLIAHALAEHLRVWKEGRPDALAKIGVIIHWALLAAVAIGFPIAGAAGIGGLRAIDGGHWFPWPLAAVAAGLGAVVLAVAIAVHRRHPVSLIAATVLLMIGVQFLFAWGYGRDAKAFSEMRALATHVREVYPTAPAFSLRPGRRAPEDLAIYLNKTVRPVPSLEAIPRLDRPRLLFVFRQRSEPIPPTPPGATPLGEVQRGGHAWHAFALPGE